MPLVVLCAMINNNYTSVDYLQIIEDRTEHFPIDEGFDQLRDQFKRTANKMTDLLCDRVIMKDAETVIADLFGEFWISVPDEKLEKDELLEYIKECPVFKIVEGIFEPYFKDLEGDLLEVECRDYLVEQLAERFIGGYLEKLLFSKGKVKFKDPHHAAAQMKEDIRIIKRFFTEEFAITMDERELMIQRMDSEEFNETYYEPMKHIFVILKS